MTDKDKTIKELKEALDSLDITNKYRLNLIRAIEYLQEKPVSEDMLEASKQYALRQVLASTDAKMSEQAYLDLRLFSGFELAVAHKDGANWQKQQMIKGAVECYIRRNRYTKKNVLNGFDVTCDAIQSFKDKDKVKVIVIKEE